MFWAPFEQNSDDTDNHHHFDHCNSDIILVDIIHLYLEQNQTEA